MTSILQDLDTGDIVLNEYNNTTEITPKEAFRQIIAGVFACERGSEILNPYYGFPFIEAVQNSGTSYDEMLIESMVADTLNPKVVQVLGSVNNIKANKKEGRRIDIDISATATTGETIQFTETVST